MEPAVVQPLPPQYIVFDLSGAGLQCFGPPPAAEHIGVPFGTQAMGLEALHRTRLSRAGLATTNRPTTQQVEEVGKVVMARRSVHAGTSDPDTVSDAGTSGLQQVAEESEDDEEVDSFDASSFCQEGFARKIEALAELVGIKGAYEPVAVLSEVVRVLQSIDAKSECSVPYERMGAI